ncbi:type I-E CRISPR-associated protein Cas6/Cse3/CasE [Azospirillum picis]|uniref:CRISPR system Cascade subunit CasE n=1 Tax=Azospirillum picis TaxID=488438 RepID=A0ABU0MSE4_9PROT|nr:type I-E CRISPR-associated protein Cas6/Cse3/CasE [Azospirillum picis]MBP2301928.1 CRISPR system Cascade subunit CasE [Azospirillum picis]MDQ0536377.1 CRISPR system Cascade subunit CasE [Azospirillum picis]
MTAALHLIRLPVDVRALSRWAAERRLGQTDGGGFDDGRALHHLLSETFGKGRLQPFRLLVPPGQAGGGGRGSLYAYCRADAAALRDEAHAVAPPEHLAVIDLAALADKPMPDDWRAGRRLGFEIRARPVRRLLAPLPGEPAEGPGEGQESGQGIGQRSGPPARPFAKGDEVDAFLVAALRRSPDGGGKGTAAADGDGTALSREAVYAGWLAERLAGAATLTAVRLASFRRHAASRKGNRRGAVTLDGPDALLQGELEVADPAAFRLALEKGVGRHRAYGFGMLLLRPASAERLGAERLEAERGVERASERA